MRVATRIGFALGVAGTMVGIGFMAGGLLGAASLIAGLVTLTAVIGITTAMIVDRLEDRRLRRPTDRTFNGRCHECGRVMILAGPVWFCTVCDRAPQHRHAFGIGRHA